MDTTELTDQDRDIMAMEKRTFKNNGTKERIIRQELGLSPVEYFLTLNQLISNPAAMAADPMLIKRLDAQRNQTLNA